MNKFNFKALAFALALIMVISAFMTACTSGGGIETESATGSTESESQKNENNTEKNPGDSENETTEKSEETDSEEVVLPVKGDFAASIVEADRLQGAVSAYYGSSQRNNLIVENTNTIIDLGLTKDTDGVMTVMNKNGGKFLNATASAYVKDYTGKYYYSTNSSSSSMTNIYRLGYYMYDVHVYGGDFFTDGAEMKNAKKLSTSLITAMYDAEKIEGSEGGYAYRITGTADPRIYFQRLSVKTSQTRYIKFSLRTTASTSGEVYVLTDDMGNSYSGSKVVPFKITSDGEFHEYVLNLSSVPGYEGTLTGLRFDIGTQIGEEIEIKDVTVFDIDGELPTVRFDRGLYVYSDKVNQVMHLIAPTDSENLLEYGFEFKIPVDQVASFITEDRKGVHDSPDGVHWGSANYVGFDIKDVGVFGFIMINDNLCGSMKVTIEDGYYVIRNYELVVGGIITEGSDVYLGHRLYFGDTHSFDELIYDAWCEHNPLTGDNITVINDGTPVGRFYSYDGLRGAYKYDVRGGNWYNIFKNAKNRHYNVTTNIKGDGNDRKIYIYTSAVANAQTLECAVLMDENNVLLPIPIEVCKNFAGDGEANDFLADIGYSEIYFPMVIGGDDDITFTMSHLYHNWGKVPLKQVDSIQFYTPFYHLSCGVTETNCLRPYYEMNASKLTGNIYALPDHRAMSAPLWTEFKNNDPQHTNGGFHNFLEYVGTENMYVTTEFVDECITSYGPTYGEIVMEYLTDDGKIKVTYTHMEMPQTDENRTFYICTYEFLDDLTVTDSKKNFSFYSVTGRYVDYGKIGYLNENNECTVVDNTLSGETYYVLGDENPYFDCFKWVGGNAETEKDYVNVACLVYNYSIMMGGESFDGGLGLYVKDGWVHLTPNTDTLNFKKGDKISLNLIIVPWGSQLSDYDRVDPDWNVREIRNNTILDPMTITAIDGEVVESVYLPRIKSLNGKSAEFTLSGGENNVTVEIQGMKNIARPVIYELVNGEWVEFVVSSKDTPDNGGNAHDYDGYMIRYDGDGTFSYSFVVDMTGDVERTFKIVVE